MDLKLITRLLLLTSIMGLCYSKTKAQSFGQKGHPMTKLTPNPQVLSYWGNVPKEDQDLYRLAHKVLSSEKNASYADLLLDKDYVSLISNQKRHLLGGPMLGSISENAYKIWLRTSKPSKVKIEYKNGDQKFFSKEVFTKMETDLTCVIEVANLETSSSYSYTIVIDDSIKISDQNFVLPARKENSVRLAFGSCPHRWGLGNERLFRTIKSRAPNAMLFLGDIAVQDRYNHLGMHRADYLLRDFQWTWRNFTSSVPIYASWDDHDYFGNDEAGIPDGYTLKDKKNVREIFKNSWVNPSYGFGDQEGGIFFKTTIGQCDLIMTDNRYFRNREKTSFLGDIQMAWLKEELLKAKGRFIVISCGTMWSDFVSKGKDSWGVYDPEGREEILNLIEEKEIAGVLFISGDRHGARGFTIKRSSGFEFYEFEAASLGARIGPPKSRPEWDSQLYGIDDTFAFGELSFNTSPDEEAVTYRLINEYGEVIYSIRLEREELNPAK